MMIFGSSPPSIRSFKGAGKILVTDYLSDPLGSCIGTVNAAGTLTSSSDWCGSYTTLKIIRMLSALGLQLQM
jgi:hypothetical protein